MSARARVPHGLAAPLSVFASAFVFHIVCSLWTSSSGEIRLPELAVFFDGHLYLEIAKSFPLPYSPDGRHYLTHAPGYPAWIAAVHSLLPPTTASWGWAGLLAAWSAAALAAVGFYYVCREAGCPPLLGAALFVVANPRWVSVASTAHAETVAMLFVVLALLGYQRDRLPASVAFLSLAVLARFPAILIGAPLAFGFLVTRSRRDLPAWLWLALPLAALALVNVYLYLRVPDFGGLSAEHAVFWDVGLTWPFAKLLEFASPAGWPMSVYGLTYGTLAACVAALGLGWRSRDRASWLLLVWVGVVLIFHASLGGPGRAAAADFSRLVVLAWPAVLLVLWCAVGNRLPKPAVVVACGLLAWGSAGLAVHLGAGAVHLQKDAFYVPIAIEQLSTDDPLWLDFQPKRRRLP
jgi:hypothetical protein